MANKIKFQYNGMTFELPTKHLQTEDWSGKKLEKPVLRINQVAAANMIKQYVKKVYPEATCFTSSDSYSMGNSTNIHVTDKFGNSASREVLRDIEAFGEQFVYGSFNAMEDIYEVKFGRKDQTTDDGQITIEKGVKYLFVTGKPKSGSLPDVYRMLSNMTSEECSYHFGQVDLETAIGHAKRFGASDTSIKKAVEMMA